MKQILILFFVATVISSYGQDYRVVSKNELKTSQNGEAKVINYNYQIIAAPNSTWGYDIYKGNKLFIHQKNRPALPGNDGFKSKLDAEKVAGLVIDKLMKGEMPPSVTKEELNKLKVF